jgi:hypothetical protein
MKKIFWPDAIYFDTNALRALPHHLKNAELANLRDICQRYKIFLFIPQLAFEELLAHRQSELTKDMTRFYRSSESLGSMLGRQKLSCEILDPQETSIVLRRNQERLFQENGFEIIPTPKLEITDLCKMFVEKKPPFQEDKGFKDVVIIRTILAHAVGTRQGQISIISGDKIFDHSSIKTEFSNNGVETYVISADSKEVVGKAVHEMERIMKEAGFALFETKQEQALKFLQSHQQEIFKFVLENARINLYFIRL